MAELHVIRDTNFRDAVASLRDIANKIEAGKWGEVGTVAVVVLGDQMQVFGAGPESNPPAVALLLHSGFLRLSLEIEKHGK